MTSSQHALFGFLLWTVKRMNILSKKKLSKFVIMESSRDFLDIFAIFQKLTSINYSILKHQGITCTCICPLYTRLAPVCLVMEQVFLLALVALRVDIFSPCCLNMLLLNEGIFKTKHVSPVIFFSILGMVPVLVQLGKIA